MCGYGLHNVKSRRAKVGDKLTARNFGTGTPGSLQAPHHASHQAGMMLPAPCAYVAKNLCGRR